MILEGNERGHGAELARHLMNARDNEHVTLHAVEGFVADDLLGAFAEAEAISAATQCRKYLFSLSLNPPPGARVSTDIFDATIARIEARLGLSGQPRAVVFHEKEGRRHAHCVWSRIDTAQLKAVNLPHYKRRLMSLSRELYIEQGWEMPAGFGDAQNRDPFNFSRVEAGQAKRSGRDPKALKKRFKACWEQSDSAQSFAAALWAAGFVLARGNRRGFVAVDAQGEIYSLSRWCGVRSDALRARLGDPDALPSVEKALARFKDGNKKQCVDTNNQHQPSNSLSDLTARQREERTALLAAQEQRRIKETRARQAQLPQGFRLAWATLIGTYARLMGRFERESADGEARDQAQRQALFDRHLMERQALQDTPLPSAEISNQTGDLSVALKKAFAPLYNDPRQQLVLPKEKTPFTRQQLEQRPALILDYLSDKQAHFTGIEVKQALARFIDDPVWLRRAIDTVFAAPELVRLPPFTADGAPSYTTKAYQQAETGLFKAAHAMAGQDGFALQKHHLRHAMAAQNKKMHRQFGGCLSGEQVKALHHIGGCQQIACVVGLAGTGKSTLLEVAHNAWTKQGVKVHGAALSGKAAEGLQAASNIPSRTLASLELSWRNGYAPIKKGDVLVLDEAGMVGTRQLNRIANKMNHIGAKLVLIGDPDQLQPIEAGQPFRHLVDKIGAAKLTGIHRQKEDWQKRASCDLATGALQEAVSAYAQHGAVRPTQSPQQALAALVEDYVADIETHGHQTSRLAFAHRRKDVFALNQAIRGAVRHANHLGGQEKLLGTETGTRAFATGDRIVFTRNDKALGVKNGMLGTVERLGENQLTVRLDGDKEEGKAQRVTFNPSQYRSFDHGYAVTIHKSQGATVDRAYVLASKRLDASLTYVAMTRHRDSLRLYLNAQDKPGWLAQQENEPAPMPAQQGLKPKPATTPRHQPPRTPHR